jgi:hypothetical protein
MGAQGVAGTVASSRVVARAAALLMVGGGVAVILGSLMPWAKLTLPFGLTQTRNGIDSGADAVFCVVVGAVACLVALRALLMGGPATGAATERALAGTVGLLGLVCVIFAGFAAKHVDDRLASLPSFTRSFIAGEIGTGIWVVLAGGVVIALAALVMVGASRQRS